MNHITKTLTCLTVIALFVPLTCLAQKYDLILVGGKIVDGTGNSWFYGDVGIVNGKIAVVGKLNGVDADSIINVHGLTVAPGFVDVHAHIERNDLSVPTADNFIFDGVTSVVTGN
ncbi:MAG TPA: D-aminoacylase, partial [Chryseosolibacter sp.]|nr:D-aminoacylase [Chryseosolibacter sp.]